MDSFKERLELAMQRKNISAAELSKMTGINEGSISQYRKGAYQANQRNLEKLALALDVSIPWLMGVSEDHLTSIPNILPLGNTTKIPLLGEIACGEPITAEENIEQYIDMEKEIHADFALRCKGDSMINARIFNGDIVYIRQQPKVENGEIAAVLIENEATLKRVYYYDNRIELRPENPLFSVLNYEGENLKEIRILGKAVAFLSKVY